VAYPFDESNQGRVGCSPYENSSTLSPGKFLIKFYLPLMKKILGTPVIIVI
jgi:hypothetical protein